MMPKRLLFSMGPPALASLIHWKKKAFVYPINMSEHQGQQNRRPPRNSIISGYAFFDRAACFAVGHMLGEENILYTINIFEHQRQRNRRPHRNFIIFGDPQP